MTWDFQQCGICHQQRLRPACAYVQTDQSLCFPIAEPGKLDKKKCTPGILFISFPSWFTLQLAIMTVLLSFVSVQHHWWCHSKSAKSCIPDKGGMYWSKFGVFAQGANHLVVDFLLMCALKSLLLWIICVQRKKSIKYRIGKSTSYLDHFCAWMYSAYVRRYS